MSRRPTTAAAALAVAGLLASFAATVPTASADEVTDAPVTAPDHVTLRGGSFALVDVLRNDSDPTGDDLAICRFEVPDGVPVNDGDSVIFYSSEDPEGGEERMKLLVQSTSFAPGHYTLTYYACDHDYLTPGTITIDIERTKPVRVRKVRPRVVRFFNPDDRAVRVYYSAFDLGQDEPDPDPDQGHFRLRPGQARRVHVEGRTMFWNASAGNGRAGDGIVTRLDRR